MDTAMWMIGVRGDQTLRELKEETKELAVCYDFKVPKEKLRVGTLDSLMSLSDDINKMETLAEGTVTKMYKQLSELKPDETPTIIGVPVVSYTTQQWEWDEAKFQVKSPLRDLTQGISARIGALDDELKLKMSEMNAVKASLQALERKTQGNLMVRGLGDIVGADDVMESEYMTTLFVVVPKAGMKEYETTYEKMGTYVVPRSAKLLYEDLEYGLYRVVVFKKSAEDFKAAARDRRYTIRDFSFEATKQADEAAKKETDKAEFDRLKGLLTNWCKINFAEAFTMMMHLKAIRIFVESVLRYGLKAGRPNFKAFVLMPNKGKHDALRKLLAGLFGGVASMMDGEEETTVPGATGEFFPYVSVTIETAPVLS